MTTGHERETSHQETQVTIDFSETHGANMLGVMNALSKFNRESGGLLCAEAQGALLFPTPSRTRVKRSGNIDNEIDQFLLVTVDGYRLIESQKTKGSSTGSYGDGETNSDDIHYLIEQARMKLESFKIKGDSLRIGDFDINREGGHTRFRDVRYSGTRFVETKDPTKIIEIFQLNMQRVRGIKSASEGIMSAIAPQSIKQ